MAKLKCAEPRGGVKTCKITEGGKTRVVRLHDNATAGTRAKRASAGRGRLKPFRFKKSDMKGCPKNPKARGKCAAKHMLARVGA